MAAPLDEVAEPPVASTEPASRAATLRRFATVAAVIIALGLAGALLPLADWMESVQAWVRALGPWGPLALGAIFVAASMLSVPVMPFSLAAGALFGLVGGTLTMWISSMIASALGFWVGRFIAYRPVHAYAMSHAKFRQIDEALGESDWKIVALVRLSHGFPFGITNYVFGALSLRFWPFMVSSAVSLLPGLVIAVYLGVIGRAGLNSLTGGWREQPVLLIPVALGAAAIIGLLAFIVRLLRRKLAEEEAGISDV